MLTLLLVFLLVQSVSIAALQRADNVGKLPALGWNSWNAYGCDVNQDKILSAAQQLAKLGLKDAGYQYVNIDDCWSVKSGRDPSTKRIIPDPAKFPNGISGTATKVHNLGFKIGIYSSAGTQTCAGYPASIGYESVDAAAFAAWGIDYLKYDNCNIPSNWKDACSACVPDPTYGGPYTNGTCKGLHDKNYCPAGYDYSKSKTAQRFTIMRDALLKQSRPILYSLCEWGHAGVQQWGPSVGASWRTTDDINTSWDRIMLNLNQNSFYLNPVDFYAHTDPDMLEVGNGALTFEENRSHFALWAAMKAPLLIGTDLAKLDSRHVNLLKNKYLLAFNQDDQYGKPAKPYKWGSNPNWTFNASFPAEYWSGRSKQGVLVLAFNPYNSQQVKHIRWADIPELKGGAIAYQVSDVWSGQQVGCLTTGFDLSVGPHDTGAYNIGGPCTPTRRSSRGSGKSRNRRSEDIIQLQVQI